MADTAVAITGIVVSGVVGPALGAWWSRSRQQADHAVELDREIRRVLDEGAAAVGATKRAFESLWALQRNGVSPDAEPARNCVFEWRQELAAARTAGDRIAIRLGEEHEVSRAYSACIAALDEQREVAWAFEQHQKPRQATYDRTNRSFREARQAYIAASRRWVGRGES
jgi:hypothetical protein